MNPGLLVLVAAQAASTTPAPTPTPTQPINILASRPDSGGVAPSGSLADVAKRIKLKLPQGQPRVLTNENIKQLAEGVELTTTIGGGPAPESARPLAYDAKKAMWQERYRAAVSRVAQLEAEVQRLEGESARLERDFYAHDDPAQRDGVIKPAWDRAVTDLQKARADLAEARGRPDEVLNEARRDGALPGWFRGLDQPGAAPAPAAEPGAPAAVGVPASPQPTRTRPPRRRAGPT